MDLSQEATAVLIGLGVLVGAVECFFGYRLLKLSLALAGFLIGGIIGGMVGATAIEGAFGAVIGAVAGGILGALLMVALYILGVLIIGAGLGALLGLVICGIGKIDPGPVVLLVPAVLCGVLAVIFQRPVIILATAFGGAWQMVAGTARLLNPSFDPADPAQLFQAGGRMPYVVLTGSLAVSIAGAAVQFHTAPKKPPKEKKEKEEA